jgi:hypothetical protein
MCYSTLGPVGETYGADFGKVVRLERDVVLRSTYELADGDERMVRDCMAYLHPIAPFDVGGPEPVLSLAPLVQTREPPATWQSTFFIQGSDAQDPDYVRRLRQRLPEGQGYYRVDSFAKDCFTVQVYVNE